MTQNTWLTSDTHYSHPNICKGVTKWAIDTPERLAAVREFKTLEEMNEALVNNINKVVMPDDLLIHDGDWSFGGFEKIEEFRSKINCKNVILFLGNHDHHVLRNKSDVRNLFLEVNQNAEMTINGVKIAFCHYPNDEYHLKHFKKECAEFYSKVSPDSLILHGHVHSKGEKRFRGGKMMDIGVCGSPEFRPYNLDEIVSALEKR